MLNYVSLMSTGFSGSTLISMLLSSQKHVVGFGDTYFSVQNNPANLCTCGQPYVDCPVRTAISEHAKANGLPDFSFFQMPAVPTPRFLNTQQRAHWPLRKAAFLPAVRAVPTGVRRLLFRRFYLETRLMLEALEAFGDYETYFDGSKSLVRLELLRSAGQPIRALHMVRHPGAYLYHFQRKGESSLDARLRGWLRYHTRARQFRERLPAGAYKAATYESMVGDPAEFLRDIAGFLKVSEIDDSEPVMLRPESVHVIGNSMRLRSREIVNMSNRWRKHLKSDWVEAAERVVEETPWLSRLLVDGIDVD